MIELQRQLRHRGTSIWGPRCAFAAPCAMPPYDLGTPGLNKSVLVNDPAHKEPCHLSSSKLSNPQSTNDRIPKTVAVKMHSCPAAPAGWLQPCFRHRGTCSWGPRCAFAAPCAMPPYDLGTPGLNKSVLVNDPAQKEPCHLSSSKLPNAQSAIDTICALRRL